MLRANCEDLNWTVDISRGQFESIALQNHRKDDLHLMCCEVHTCTDSGTKTEGNEHDWVVVGGSSNAFCESLWFEEKHVFSPDFGVMVKLEISYYDVNIGGKNKFSQPKLLLNLPRHPNDGRV